MFAFVHFLVGDITNIYPGNVEKIEKVFLLMINQFYGYLSAFEVSV